MALRIFISQSTIDEWVSGDQVDLAGEIITIKPSNHQLRLTPASYFKSMAGGSSDGLGLIGKVKNHDAIDGLGGEAYMSSVVIGEDAYDVEPGFLGTEVSPGPDQANVLHALATMVR